MESPSRASSTSGRRRAGGGLAPLDPGTRAVYHARVSSSRPDPLFTGYLLAVNPRQGLLDRLFSLLKRSRRPYAVIGAHARNAHVRDAPRATVDLDVLIDPASAAIVAERARERLGLRAHEGPLSIRLTSRGRKIADLVFSGTERLYEQAVADARPRRIPGLGTGKVPGPEMIVALKLLAATAPGRATEKRFLDLGDAAAILRRGLDRRRLRGLVARLGPDAAAKLREIS